MEQYLIVASPGCLREIDYSAELLVYAVGNINTNAAADQGSRQEERGEGVLYSDGRKSDAGYADADYRQQGVADNRA